MSAIFCHNCGKKLVIGSKFCSYCGTNLASLSFTPTKSTPSQQPPMVVTATKDEDDDDDYIDKLEHLEVRIDKLDVDIVHGPSQVNETIGTLMTSAKSQTIKREPPRTGPYSNINREEFLKNFQQEAGAIRSSNEKRPSTS